MEGLTCDVCGERLSLLPLPFVSLNRKGNACGTCHGAVARFNATRNVEELPEGPMREAITQAVVAETAFACLDELRWLRQVGGVVDFRPTVDGWAVPICSVRVDNVEAVGRDFLEACAHAREVINPSPADSGQPER